MPLNRMSWAAIPYHGTGEAIHSSPAFRLPQTGDTPSAPDMGAADTSDGDIHRQRSFFSTRQSLNPTPGARRQMSPQLRMRPDTSLASLTSAAIIASLAISGLVSSVSGVWTCPSEREPFCCAMHSRVNDTSDAFVGTGCVDAPRNDNCTNGIPVECCKPLTPESPKYSCSASNANERFYCDSKAIGYAT
ncbi:uncharacterized protein PADG_06634 [Paracoccidioides brasiliensis Pb18]|uniref:Hydrophobin n=1 Tax=Paracoccidioides brasiliensis (strain Pb18) TaxID=502780 RepID=C1GH98_PARBD|nr:uncharacterized protein PADG_06634 [Paracoccidioides brasiliensis Pb18]EEH50555.1 hypothetical protein PADG_06634 [Paracoccidioides brasiliensis Pb18]